MKTVPRLAIGLLAVAAFLAARPAGADPLPPAFTSLLPNGAALDADSGDWGGFDGSAVGSLQAKFPGTPRNCFRLESELVLELNYDSSLPNDMLEEFAQEGIEQSRAGLAEEARNRGRKEATGSLDVVAVGEVVEEQVPGGLLMHYEYTESCANRESAKVASLRGHAFGKGGILYFSLLMNTGLADARARAVEILERFAAFDVEAALRGE